MTRAATDRIAHVHLKDVDADLAERWRAGGFDSMRTAVDAGVWRPLGAGDARVDEAIALLVAADYDGWYVLERDASLDANAAGDDDVRVADAVREREWVEQQLATRAQVGVSE